MERVKYNWGNVPMGGGGFVTGFYVHPKDPKVKYMRTDVGGAYKWNHDKEEWMPITEWVPRENGTWYGVDGIALDPNDTETVYLCLGDSGKPSDVVKSTDGAKTFTPTGLNKNFLGNGPYRDLGECIQIDPNNSDIIYCGTRWHGLWRSLDGAESWEHIDAIPQGTDKAGVKTVLIDKNTKENGKSSVIYCCPQGEGLWKSSDAGKTWCRMEGSPENVARGAVFEDGRVAVTSDKGIFLYEDGEWKDISPVKNLKYNGIDVDRRNNNRLVAACTINEEMSPMNLPLYYSEDCGKTWRHLNDTDTCKKNYSIGWWPRYYFSGRTSCIYFGMETENDVWFADWYGTWRTNDVTAEVVEWDSKIEGHEEIVAFTLVSPPEGKARLLTGVADNAGMRYEDIHDFPPERRPISTNGMDFCEADCNFIAAIGAIHHGVIGEMGVSYDNGITWKKMVNWDDNEIGMDIAVNPVNPDNMCAFIINGTPRFTNDGGMSWHYAKGTPKDLITSFWSSYGNIISDRVADGVYYVFCKRGLFRSMDGGAHFELLDENRIKGRVRTLPYHKGELWHGDETGLFRSTDFGDTFEKIETVEECYSFDFGKGRYLNECTLYVYGKIEGVISRFRSDDYGKTWVDIGDGVERCRASVIYADRKVYGRIYLSSGGRGIYFAEPVEE